MNDAIHRRGARLVLFSVASLLVSSVATQSTVARAGGGTCLAGNRSTGQIYPPSAGTTLQQAIDEAGEGNILEVRGRCAGGFSIDKPLTLVGKPTVDFPVATLDGQRTTRVLIVLSAPVTLTKLRITRGRSGPEAGGILNAGELTLGSTLVNDNSGTQWGGGIYNQGSLVLKGDSHVSANSAGVNGGGGIYNLYGVVELRGSSTVTRNSSQNVGGGIYNASGTVALYRSSRVDLNGSGNSGGGIYNNGTVELNGFARVSGNIAGLNPGSSAGGGGVANEGGSLILNGDSRVNRNTARAGGGGVCNFGVALAEMLVMNDRSQIIRNTARDGGGICNDEATISMHDSSRVTGNVASRDGGGIWDVDGAITMTDSSSITRNTAQGAMPSAPAGIGGGIRVCRTTLTGVSDGVNVFNNDPDDIAGCP